MAGRMKSIHLISPKASEYQPGADLYKKWLCVGGLQWLDE